MKKIVAVIKPLKLDEVKEKLIEAGVTGVTVSEIRGSGKQGKDSRLFLSAHEGDLLPKMEVMVVVPDEKVEDAVRAILDSARTDKVGDGKIFVYDVEESIRIRTGERGNIAL